MDIRTSVAALNYAATKPATEPSNAVAETGNNAFLNVAKDFAETLQEGESKAKAAMTGNADSHSLVQALAETQLAVETAVTVRDKVVEAYQEILRMPV
jgi:flagellar hook-basal body complex protein FliE